MSPVLRCISRSIERWILVTQLCYSGVSPSTLMDYIRPKLNKHCSLKKINTSLLKMMLARASGNFLLYQISPSNPYYILSTFCNCFLFSLLLLNRRFWFPLKYKIIDNLHCLHNKVYLSCYPTYLLQELENAILHKIQFTTRHWKRVL